MMEISKSLVERMKIDFGVNEEAVIDRFIGAINEFDLELKKRMGDGSILMLDEVISILVKDKD